MMHGEPSRLPRRSQGTFTPSTGGTRASRQRGNLEESQKRIVDKVIRRHCAKHNKQQHTTLELDTLGPLLPSTSTMLSPEDKFHLPPISPCTPFMAASPVYRNDIGDHRVVQHPPQCRAPSILPVITPKTPSRYRLQCTPSNRGSIESVFRPPNHSPMAPYVYDGNSIPRDDAKRHPRHRRYSSDGQQRGSPVRYAPRLPKELPPLDLASLPAASPTYGPLVLDTPAIGLTPKSPHGVVWTPIERPPSTGINCHRALLPPPTSVDTIIEGEDELRVSYNDIGNEVPPKNPISPPRMSLSPSPPLGPRTSPMAEFPTEVHVSGVVELGGDDDVVQSPAKPRKDDNAVSDSAVVFRSPNEKPRPGKRRPLRRLRHADNLTPPAAALPRLVIDTNLANVEEKETPMNEEQQQQQQSGGSGVRRQAEMFSLDDTGGHLRLSRLSKEGLDSTIIVAEKDVSWIGESPEQTDTEDGSDTDKAAAAVAVALEDRSARSPAGRHFHVWGGAAAMSGSAMGMGGNRKGRRRVGRGEDREQRKGRVVEQFRNAVDEHRRAEEMAKRQVFMDSLSSSAGVVDVMNIKKGQHVISRMPTMLRSGWIRGKALGAGTSATAYLAQRGADGFLFVVKEVPLSGKGLLWKDLPRDLRNEAVVLSRARHISGVVEFFGCEVIGDKFCLYMEYLGGGTLASLAPASPSKRLPEAQASGYLRKIIRTLRSLHHGAGGLMGSRDSGAVFKDKGELITPIMHRDVKGTNCLLSSDRKTVKLCDFGSCTRPRPFSFQGTPLAADGKKLNESIDLTSDIPPDCTAIIDDNQQVIGFAPRRSSFSDLHEQGDVYAKSDELSLDLVDSMAESGGHHKSSAERRYENPQFFFKSMKGTLRWMAPETLGGHDYSAKVDVWSVGCLLIEMVCGQDPWREFDNEIQAMHEIWTARDKTPIDYIKPEIWSQCSEECKDFMRKTVQRDPQARPTCAELLQHPFVRVKR